MTGSIFWWQVQLIESILTLLLLEGSNHCSPGTAHKSCSFGIQLALSSHQNLALVTVYTLLQYIFTVAPGRGWDILIKNKEDKCMYFSNFDKFWWLHSNKRLQWSDNTKNGPRKEKLVNRPQSQGRPKHSWCIWGVKDGLCSLINLKSYSSSNCWKS